jgi:uncharacterized membrane protein
MVSRLCCLFSCCQGVLRFLFQGEVLFVRCTFNYQYFVCFKELRLFSVVLNIAFELGHAVDDDLVRSLLEVRRKLQKSQ